jgi:hypothetical protein
MKMTMTPEEKRVAHAVVRWLQIKLQFEERYDPLRGPTLADVDHSSLLQRLLDGKEPLPVPPPKQYSYPAYHLVEEDGPQYVYEVWFNDPGQVVIEQSPWQIVEKLSEEDYIVQWGQFDQRYRLHKKDNVKIGMHIKDDSIYGRAWVLEKLPKLG